MKTINIGKGHTIMANRIIGVFKFGSRSTIQLKKDFEKTHKAINLNGGEKTRTLILSDEGWLFVSSVSAQTITERIEKLELAI